MSGNKCHYIREKEGGARRLMRSELTILNKSSHPQSRILSPFSPFLKYLLWGSLSECFIFLTGNVQMVFLAKLFLNFLYFPAHLDIKMHQNYHL